VTDIAVPYFSARPATPPPWPGVIVVHEGNGMSPQLLRVCQRLAAEGYATIAPDLFWRFGGSDPNNFMEHIQSIQIADVLADLYDAHARLREEGAQRVGITGFCMGGRFSYLASLSDLDLACAAPFYGIIANDLGEPRCPVLLLFGGNDEYIPMDDIKTVEKHHAGDVVVYAQAGHGFMRDGSDNYDEAAATDAWSRLLAFFALHLR
jgi:carboxymethylenebutenolidase